MNRCILCKKIVWPWQKTFGGVGKAHKHCDYKTFCLSLDKLVMEGSFTPSEAENQKALRRTCYF